MQVQKITFTQYSPQTVKLVRYTNPSQADSISFSGQQQGNDEYIQAQKYANRMKILNFFIPQDLRDYNLHKLEGVQNGIKIFENLNMKEISFMFENLHAITAKRGCSNQCLHCYAGALPAGKEHDNYINKMPFETFVEVTDGLKELRKRLGITPNIYDGEHYTDLYYDADCMEIVLYDKNGKEHDLPELIDRYYNATGSQSVFDTSGWNHQNPKMQARAEKYVKYLTDYDNSEKFYQINLSLSPFNALYAKAIELGYNPKNFTAGIPVEALSEQNLDKGEKLYRIYIDRMANMLFTFTPLLGNPNFSIIARPLDNSEKNMKNFTLDDYNLIKKHILDTLYSKYLIDAKTDKKYVNKKSQIPNLIFEYSILLNSYDTDLIFSGRFKDLYIKRNPGQNIDDIENKFKNVTRFKNSFNTFKQNKDLDKTGVKYLKIIDANGKLYLYDGFRFLPTELQLNISTKDKTTPEFSPEPEDFIITKEMINKRFFNKKSR